MSVFLQHKMAIHVKVDDKMLALLCLRARDCGHMRESNMSSSIKYVDLNVHSLHETL
jgi:hypothetical protein